MAAEVSQGKVTTEAAPKSGTKTTAKMLPSITKSEITQLDSANSRCVFLVLVVYSAFFTSVSTLEMAEGRFVVVVFGIM